MNRDKHIWEGWTVGDFIDDIEPIFNMCAPFMDKQSLKRWVAQELSLIHISEPTRPY